MFGDNNIIGVRLFEFINWADASFRWIENYASKFRRDDDVPEHGLLALPPMQRSAVWRAKQVLDLWDSVLSGMPIGSFYLIEQLERNRAITQGERTIHISGSGYDLLDGQQRLRALLAGAKDFRSEKRCLWIDLGASEKAIKLYITSKAQPFGYDSQGQRLGVAVRRRAREELETVDNERISLRFTSDGSGRDVYDSDLFDAKSIYRGSEEISCPPRPHGVSENTFKLNDLIRVWLKAREDEVKSGDSNVCLRALKDAFGEPDAIKVEAYKNLHTCFSRAFTSEVALIRVNPENFPNKQEDLLPLFARIGAGGTALTDNEQRYSIYKFHVPHVRDAVNKIHAAIGRVLSGTEIAVCAIRIAYSELHTAKNGDDFVNMPDVRTFSNKISEKGDSNTFPFRERLKNLLPEENSDDLKNDLFAAFRKICDNLRHTTENEQAIGNHWVPDIVLANLPSDLWQVLTYYVVRNPNAEISRQDIVRFVMWWYLFVIDNSKASAICFKKIRNQSITGGPGRILYAEICLEKHGFQLVPCKIAKETWFTSRSIDYEWKTYEERFGKDNNLNRVCAHWWGSFKKSLFWLQKEYLRENFPGFDPLSEHDEDTPYDFDHICPANDFYYSIWSRFDTEDVPKEIQNICERGRRLFDASIGNYRIVTSSQNRYDSDDDISKKLPAAIRFDNLTDDQKKDLSNFALSGDEESLKLWARVSRNGECKNRLWNKDRLAAFQQAVEHRTAWLYCKFYNELGFAEWEMTETSE